MSSPSAPADYVAEAAPAPALSPVPDAAPTGPPVEPQRPGRDLAVLLVLVFATDFSALLHIYGLAWLVSEPLFLGLGWTMVLAALLLLILPAREPPGWLQFPVRRPLAALALIVCTTLIALAAGNLLDAMMNPAAWVVRDPHRDTGIPALLGNLLVQLGALAAVPALAFTIAYLRDEALRRTWIALATVLFFTLATVNLLFDAGVGRRAPDTWAIVFASGQPAMWWAGGLFAVAGGLVLLRPARFLAVAVGAGLGLRIAAIWAIPLTIHLGDMLPLNVLATGRLLGGLDPYVVYHMPWELPLTYWPLNVLSYLPAAAAGIDLRWTNLLFGPLVGALLLLAGGRRGPGAAGHAFGLLYVTPAMLQWDLSTAAPPYWLWLCVAFAATVVAAHRRRPGPLLAGAALGAALAAAPLALPFAPALLGGWLARGWRAAWRPVVVAGAVFALLVGPFVLWDAPGFWNGAVSWFNDLTRLPLLKWQSDRSWAFEIGLAGPFWENGLQTWLKPLQAVLVGGLFLAGLLLPGRPLATPAGVLRWGAATYLLFLVVNPVIWPYLFAPALLALVFALLPGADAAAMDLL